MVVCVCVFLLLLLDIASYAELRCLGLRRIYHVKRFLSYLFFYIYIYMCVCVSVCALEEAVLL